MEDNKNFNAKMLIKGFMDSTFETNAEEWAEIVKIGKMLEKHEILIPGADGGYNSPYLGKLKKAINENLNESGSTDQIIVVLEAFKKNLESVKTFISEKAVPDNYNEYFEHINELDKIFDAFSEGIKAVTSMISSMDEAGIDEEIKKMEELAGSSTFFSKEEKSKERMSTKFLSSRDGRTGGKEYFSPCFDTLSHTIDDYEEGTVEKEHLIEIISEIQGNIEAFYEYFNTELEYLKEDDPEVYSMYRDVITKFSNSHQLCSEGLVGMNAALEEGNDEYLKQYKEVFFKGVQEMVGVHMLLDMLKKNGF